MLQTRPSALTGISACAKHASTVHIKIWSLYNGRYVFNRCSDYYSSQGDMEVRIKCTIFCHEISALSTQQKSLLGNLIALIHNICIF